MTQAIITRYLPPTNTRGARIKAFAWGGSITVPFAYDCAVDVGHARAAQALCEKMNWPRTGYVGAGTPDERGFCFVALNAPDRF